MPSGSIDGITEEPRNNERASPNAVPKLIGISEMQRVGMIGSGLWGRDKLSGAQTDGSHHSYIAPCYILRLTEGSSVS